MDKYYLSAWVAFGSALGFSLCSVLVIEVNDLDQHKAQKEQCEAELPRNQVCIFKYVPEGEQ